MIGKTVAHYRILEEIGRGGMGIVYKAEDTKLKRTVALKFLPPSVGSDERARFEVEAQSIAHLQHPNICSIYEINEIDGQAYIVMPFIDGVELKQHMASRPMDIPEAVAIALQVATALQEAHEHGIIHRDIKSANVMITPKGLAKVMDFGLAKRTGSTQITQAGTSLGTIDYMSPEQASGRPVDHRTDIWSFGVLLHEMVVGRMPFTGEFDQAVIYSILNQDAEPLTAARAEAPPELERIVAKTMAKQPDNRYQSMADVVDELHELQAEVGVPRGLSATMSSVGGGGSRVTQARVPGQEDSVVKRLAARGVPQKLGIYLGVSFLVVLGLNWLVDHFPVSPNLPNFALAALLLLVPAVVMLAYSRSVARVAVPINMVVAAAVLFFGFQGKDLGAATETVRVTDAEGNTIERALPKGEFRKRVAVFYFDNETGDPANDWLSYGIAQMLRAELLQDTYVSIGLGFTKPHAEAGFDKPVGSPLTLKRDFANRFHYPMFTSGSFDLDGETYRVTLTLHDTASGKAISERTYAADVFAIVDTMSVQLRHDVGVPDYHIAETTDLPVTEIFSGSVKAVENYVMGVNAVWQDNDYGSGATYLEEAVEEDAAFTTAYRELYGCYTSLNKGAQATEAIRMALRHKYRLPESEQYSLMDDYLESREDFEGKLDNARRWAALYPESPEARLVLASQYERLNEFDAAIQERRALYEVDPQRYEELHNIGNLYEKLGADEKALEYYNEYADLHPDKFESYSTIGRFYRRRGDFENARHYYRQALLRDPERMWLRTTLAEIERHTGNFEASLQQCNEALASAHTAQDSVNALWQLVEYHSFRGHAKRANEYQVAALETMGRTTSPIQVMITRLFTLPLYVEAGRFDDAIAIVDQAEAMEGVQWLKSIISAAYIITYATNEDESYLPQVEKHVARFAKWMEETRNDQLTWALKYCMALEQVWQGDREAALQSIREGLDYIPPEEVDNKVWMNRSAGDIALEIQDYAQAEQFFNEVLTLEPYSPDGHLGLAKMYHAQGDTEKAIEHLRQALEVWEDADPGHPRAGEAKALAAQWRLSS